MKDGRVTINYHRLFDNLTIRGKHSERDDDMMSNTLVW